MIKILLVVILLITSLSFQSCEKLKQKMKSRNRRIEYIKKNIDSARKHNESSYDSTAKNNQ